MADHAENLRRAFGKALKALRKEKELTQEDFSIVSSRTYLSTLERGLKSPTLEKIDALAQVLGVHPLTLLAASYREIAPRKKSSQDLLAVISKELRDLKL